MRVMNHISRSFASLTIMSVLVGLLPIPAANAAPFDVTLIIDGVVQTSVYPGDLVRGTTFSAVYYVGEDGFRYVFPNEKTYKTWYSDEHGNADFSTVKILSDANLAAMQMGGNVTYRPGSKMIKINSDPKTYQVAAGGVLRWVTSEEVAVAIYGTDWNTKIDDVADGFFTNYEIGTAIESIDDLDEAVCFDKYEPCDYTISDDKDLTMYSMVIIEDMAFRDVTAGTGTVTTIQVGDTVMFFNTDNTTHTATADDASWGTGTIQEMGNFVRRFDEPGTYTYFCSYHPEMTGTIIVEEALTM